MNKIKPIRSIPTGTGKSGRNEKPAPALRQPPFASGLHLPPMADPLQTGRKASLRRRPGQSVLLTDKGTGKLWMIYWMPGASF